MKIAPRRKAVPGSSGSPPGRSRRSPAGRRLGVRRVALQEPTPRNVPELFLDRVGRSPAAEAFRHPTATGWRSLTWQDTEARVRAIAGGLRALGLEPERPC